MTDLFDPNVETYKVIIAPFLMMTSCATLVWTLQTRFSRIVQAIRSLSSEGQRDDIDYSHSLAVQVAWLKGRSKLLRNSVAGLYLAMVCFLLSAMALTAAIVANLNLAAVSVALFLAGLALLCIALAYTLLETGRSYDSLQEEVENH